MQTIIAFIALLTMNSSFLAPQDLNRHELLCLSKAVYHEARGEPIEGQIAVAHVVINRSQFEAYPNQICKVVYQPHQFTDIEKTKPDYDSEAWKTAVEVATLSYIGFLSDPTDGSMWYYAHKKINMPWWASKKEKTVRIGGHTFFRKKDALT